MSQALLESTLSANSRLQVCLYGVLFSIDGVLSILRSSPRLLLWLYRLVTCYAFLNSSKKFNQLKVLMNNQTAPTKSLLVPLKQVSEKDFFDSDFEVIQEDSYYDRALRPGTSHQFIKIRCMCCSHTFDVPVYCGNRFCEICSQRRQSRMRRRLKWLVNQICLDKGYGFKHLTLTIPNQSDLPAMVKFIIKAFRKMRSRAYWKNHVRGGASVIEITGRPGNWHVHIHAVIEARYMDWGRLHKLWKKCSGGDGTYIQRLSKTNIVGYLTKYLTKSSAPQSVLLDMSEALKGTRMFSPFGTWYAKNCKYASFKPACPECSESDLMLDDFVLYGKYRGTFTKYGGMDCRISG